MGTADEDRAIKQAQAERLRLARGRFYRTAADAWRANKTRFGGPTEVTYQHHENGRRGYGKSAHIYAETYDVPIEWLLRGLNPPAWTVGADVQAEERLGGADHFLRSWRLRAGKTEGELAAAVGVPTDFIQRWEDGSLDLSGKKLRAVADALDTTPGLILDVDPDMVPSAVLETWLRQVRQQPEMRAQLAALKTGTGG